MTKTFINILTASIVAAVVIFSACSGTAETSTFNSNRYENNAAGFDAQFTSSESLIDSVQPVSEEITPADVSTSAAVSGFGSKTALTDPNLTLASMLTYAIQDEYLAHAEYVAVIDAYGNQNPFTNIIKAEEAHIASLKPLFDEYNIALPADDTVGRIVIPESVSDALEIGVVAEIDNIDMYRLFLGQDIPDDVRAVFNNLMNASESHLAAFQNALGR